MDLLDAHLAVKENNVCHNDCCLCLQYLLAIIIVLLVLLLIRYLVLYVFLFSLPFVVPLLFLLFIILSLMTSMMRMFMWPPGPDPMVFAMPDAEVCRRKEHGGDPLQDAW